MLSDFRARIPANKFYPPRFNASQCLYRRHLVEDVLWRLGDNKQVILIEAQAGQGKTTLIQQYLDRYKLSSAWYQIGREDRDPIMFAASLLVCLSRALPSLPTQNLEKMFAAGQVSTDNLDSCLHVLLHHLDTTLKEDFFIIFDDLHLLQGCEEGLAVLKLLTENAPPLLRFAFAARRPSGLDFRGIFSTGNAIFLDNLQIALSKDEAQELFHAILEIDIPGAKLDQLYQATDGWAMGLILAAHGLKTGPTQQNPLPTGQEGFLAYFRYEVYEQLPEHDKINLLLLSQLDEIPIDLAILLTGRSNIATDLEKLQMRNFFVRSLDEQGHIFSLHHLFQEFLQDQARIELPGATIKNVCSQAAGYYQNHDQPLKALDYFIRAEDYDGVEELLKQEGVALIAQNRTQSLTISFERIPSELITSRGWLTLFSGVAALENKNTTTARPLLEKACELFNASGDKRGELLARSQLCWFHLLSTGLYNEGAKHLAVAKELYDAKADSLSDIEKTLLARNLSAPSLLFLFDIESCDVLSEMGIELAAKLGWAGILATLYASRFYSTMFRGRLAKAAEQFEEFYSLARITNLEISGSLLIKTAEVNLLENHGNLDAYERIKARENENTGKDLLSSFLLGPYFTIWDLTLDISRGNFEHAREILTENETNIQRFNPHYRGLILQKGAYILSLVGEKTQALAWMKEAKTERDLAGGPYFVTYQSLYAAATCCELAMHDEAKRILADVARRVENVENDFFESTRLLHQVWLAKKTGQTGYQADLKTALKLMRKNRFTYLRALPPKVMEPLLGEAVRVGIEPDYARLVAATWHRKAILDDGAVIPQLEIRLLGSIKVTFAGQTVCTGDTLTSTQRALLALLVAMPGQQISQEHVQLIFWPESPPSKARANFDTLLSRCRKTLKAVIPAKNVKHYLSLRKGIVSLNNCWIDVNDFREKAENGLRHRKKHEYWQANNLFYSAFQLWQGIVAPEVFGAAEAVESLRREILGLGCRAAEVWSEILTRFKQNGESIGILRKTLRHDPLNERLMHRLFQLLNQQSGLQAQQLLADYREAMGKEEYSDEEITASIAKIIDSPEREKTDPYGSMSARYRSTNELKTSG